MQRPYKSIKTNYKPYMNELNTINQFLSEIGCHFKCYEMGRLIQTVKTQKFIDFELSNIPWDSPFMQHAWIGLVFWQSKQAGAAQNHTVWFLKLPLDEQAKLNLAARDEFLQGLFKTLEHALTNRNLSAHELSDQGPGDQELGDQELSNKKSAGEQFYCLENAMKDNPYGFQPKQEQLANFHAIVQQQFNLPASSSYQDAKNYFSDAAHFDQWQQLGFQGIADLTARLKENHQGSSNQELIIKAIPRLPLSSFHALSLCLQNHVISATLAQAVFEKLSLQLDKNSSSALSCIASLQATAKTQDSARDIQAQLLTKVLLSPCSSDIEVLAIIAGRCWQALFLRTELLLLFLESLAGTVSSQYPGAFDAIVSDLIFIPGMRDKILQVFRSPDRSEQLISAIAAFLKQSRTVNH